MLQGSRQVPEPDPKHLAPWSKLPQGDDDSARLLRLILRQEEVERESFFVDLVRRSVDRQEQPYAPRQPEELDLQLS